MRGWGGGGGGVGVTRNTGGLIRANEIFRILSELADTLFAS